VFSGLSDLYRTNGVVRLLLEAELAKGLRSQGQFVQLVFYSTSHQTRITGFFPVRRSSYRIESFVPFAQRQYRAHLGIMHLNRT